ncbi:MAG: hypothetical protein RBS80_03760 [Thermoguttaceae bacterium]|jgi:hypothetical protein|nr:hypothetical protein [Thermoguttaceae bacterium]
MEGNRRRALLIVWPPGIAGLVLAAGMAHAVEPAIVRLNDGRPIISQQSFLDAGAEFAAQGANINGPSLIRVPDWISPADRPHPEARYYLYFADHNGAFIRMAWAAKVDGPYALFGQHALAEGKPRGVLDLGSRRRKPLGNGLELRGHVASPDVRVDNKLRRIEMIFHAPTYHNGASIGQKSFVAVSSDGLDFNRGIEPVVLGFAYFRVFEWAGGLYAVAGRGALYKARDSANPFTAPADFDYSKELWLPQGANPSDNPFQKAIDAARTAGELPAAVERARHFAVEATEAGGLRFLYTRVGDAPERILASCVAQPAADFAQWEPSFPPQQWLRPRLPWEGADEPNVPSRAGAARGLIHQLRDPYVFRDIDGRRYLLYSGGGERGIGIAEIKSSEP